MPKVKIPKQNITLDMTAMCDVAFLLLTFFMLTAKFKPAEAVAVDMPSSHSEIKLPDEDMMLITIDKEGTVYFGVLGQQVKRKTLEKMSQKYGVKLTDDEITRFEIMESVGVPMSQVKSVLNLDAPELEEVDFPGVPVDSADNQLSDWVKAAWISNKEVSDQKMRIAVKGDKDVNYEQVKRVIDILQSQNINKFNLITTLEGA